MTLTDFILCLTPDDFFDMVLVCTCVCSVLARPRDGVPRFHLALSLFFREESMKHNKTIANCKRRQSSVVLPMVF